MTVEFKITADGSHTLFVPGLDENYHSVYGAIAESRHIFLEAGFKHVCRPPGKISILEVGFGTGLNALLTVMESDLSGCPVDYTAIELNPLPQSIYSLLNYPEILNCKDCHSLFRQIHESPWNLVSCLAKEFSLLKLITSLESYIPEKEAFDLVYFDAFGPDVQPEMWTREVFEKMASGLKQRGGAGNLFNKRNGKKKS